VAEDEWGRNVVNGWVGFVLKSKLKGLKISIKNWNRVEYGDVDTKLEKLNDEIGVLDARSECGILTNEEVETRKKKFEELWRLFKIREAMLFQSNKSKWLREGVILILNISIIELSLEPHVMQLRLLRRERNG